MRGADLTPEQEIELLERAAAERVAYSRGEIDDPLGTGLFVREREERGRLHGNAVAPAYGTGFAARVAGIRNLDLRYAREKPREDASRKERRRAQKAARRKNR